MSNYIIHVDQQDFSVTTNDLSSLDIHQISTTNFHLLQDHQAYDVEIITEKLIEKTMTIMVNGNSYRVKIDDEHDTMVAQMGLFEKTETKSNNIMAPMPGYIIDIMVNAGDPIEKGTPLFVLSAMKMENVILSDGKGIVKSIEAKIDDSVDKGQLIIEMES
jgi:biotin carboxyl carrier protein|uniref:acetyl-CoA carboxylase biotin carboxyl carrier protein subunit n=1 Tax=Nonlabens sp. Ci31 TaxID=2608253 RepID=UPI001475F2EC|nr:acetyl-CoA carboxylase biotin carboxyl carrier protein subunit [Nonlabens sp. Ci31]